MSLLTESIFNSVGSKSTQSWNNGCFFRLKCARQAEFAPGSAEESREFFSSSLNVKNNRKGIFNLPVIYTILEL